MNVRKSKISFSLGLIPRLTFCALLLFSASTRSDELVLKSTVSPSEKLIIPGTIIDFTGVEVRIQSENGQELKYPTQRVIEIKVDRTPEHQSADELFFKFEYKDAEQAYRNIIDLEKRIWLRREMIARLCVCLREQGKWSTAAPIFFLLVKSDPQTQYFDSIPLMWTSSQVSGQLEQQAIDWTNSENPEVQQLIGASYLLSGSHRTRAKETLNRLARSTDSRILWAAQAQLWRTSLVSTQARDLEQWNRTISKMPDSVRPGAYFLVGKGYQQHKNHAQASLAMLRIPILYPMQRTLSVQALMDSASALKQDQQTQEAIAIYREILTSYPDFTEYQRTAEIELKKLLETDAP